MREDECRAHLAYDGQVLTAMSFPFLAGFFSYPGFNGRISELLSAGKDQSCRIISKFFSESSNISDLISSDGQMSRRFLHKIIVLM